MILRRIDERAMGTVGRLLADKYSATSADAAELERLLSDAQVNAERRDRLRALMPRRFP